MRVVSNKTLKLFAEKHPLAEKPLQDWRKNIEKSHFDSFSDLKQMFNSVDKAGEYYVFDISGNRYRLIAAIHFNTQILYVREIMTHSSYNRWKP